MDVQTFHADANNYTEVAVEEGEFIAGNVYRFYAEGMDFDGDSETLDGWCVNGDMTLADKTNEYIYVDVTNDGQYGPSTSTYLTWSALHIEYAPPQYWSETQAVIEWFYTDGKTGYVDVYFIPGQEMVLTGDPEPGMPAERYIRINNLFVEGVSSNVKRLAPKAESAVQAVANEVDIAWSDGLDISQDLGNEAEWTPIY
ncbi:MAG: hypothetical protein IJV83_00040 [Clostridia bacterium]|nr:hypothetical protein [Clostridia bacterium]